MSFVQKNRTALVICLFILLLTGAVLGARSRSSTTAPGSSAARSSTMSRFPRVFLWAWERPEHLNFIDTKEVGVAFLARTIRLSGDRVIASPRLQSLEVPPGTTLMAVIRIEQDRDQRASLSATQQAALVVSVLQVTALPNISALQIDYDATRSEREFYKRVLFDVRQGMPKQLPLSMTALASWCIFDNWIDDLPIDEAVPMLFDMGVDSHRINNFLNSGGAVHSRQCTASIGLSIDEKTIPLSNASRVYFFSSKPWSEKAVHYVLKRSRNETFVP